MKQRNDVKCDENKPKHVGFANSDTQKGRII